MRGRGRSQRRSAFLTAVAVCGAITPLGGQTLPSPATIQQQAADYMSALERAHDFSGVVLVVRANRTLFNGRYGMANREEHTPIDSKTGFMIGSITKSFTAAAIELLAARGQLSLNDPITKYLPNVGHGDSVTIAQLLAHTSGVPDYYRWPEYRERHCEPINALTFAALVRSKPLDFPPGRGNSYSNSGYFLLAALVERVTGEPFGAFLHRELLAKPGMTATGVVGEGTALHRLAVGYDPGFPPNWFQRAPCVDASWLFGSGSIVSTAEDMVRWGEAVAADVRQVDAASHPWYGWGVADRFGHHVIEQNGRIPLGFVSYLGVWPADSLIVVALGNAQVDVAERIGSALAAIVFGKAYDPPRIPTAVLAAMVDPTVAGAYEIAPGFVLSVRATARGVELAGPDGIFIPLDAESRDRFFFRALYTPITFVRDSSGAVSALRWGTSFTAARIAKPNEIAR